MFEKAARIGVEMLWLECGKMETLTGIFMFLPLSRQVKPLDFGVVA